MSMAFEMHNKCRKIVFKKANNWIEKCSGKEPPPP